MKQIQIQIQIQIQMKMKMKMQVEMKKRMRMKMMKMPPHSPVERALRPHPDERHRVLAPPAQRELGRL